MEIRSKSSQDVPPSMELGEDSNTRRQVMSTSSRDQQPGFGLGLAHQDMMLHADFGLILKMLSKHHKCSNM